MAIQRGESWVFARQRRTEAAAVVWGVEAADGNFAGRGPLDVAACAQNVLRQQVVGGHECVEGFIPCEQFQGFCPAVLSTPLAVRFEARAGSMTESRRAGALLCYRLRRFCCWTAWRTVFLNETGVLPVVKSTVLSPAMEDWFEVRVDEATRKQEREKARKLRKSNWWKNEIAKGICYYCKERFDPAELTMDHIVPVARGGKSTKSNIVPCCKECNSDKKMQTPVDQILKQLIADNLLSDDDSLPAD